MTSCDFKTFFLWIWSKLLPSKIPKIWQAENSWGYVAEIPPWLGRKARNDETKSNRGTKSRNVHDNWCQRIYTVLKRLAQLLLLALKPGKLSNFKDKFESLYLSAADVSSLEYVGLMYWLLRIVYISLHLFTFVYICLHLFKVVYICLQLFTFVYIYLHLFKFV